MTWTYANNPSGSTRDMVRFLIGDTDNTDQQLSDEEISALLSTFGTARSAAEHAARALAAKFTRLVSKSVGDLSIQYQQRAAAYRELAADLKASHATAGVTLFAGGISKADRETRDADTDRVKPRFDRGKFDNAGASTADELSPPDVD